MNMNLFSDLKKHGQYRPKEASKQKCITQVIISALLLSQDKVYRDQQKIKDNSQTDYGGAAQFG